MWHSFPLFFIATVFVSIIIYFNSTNPRLELNEPLRCERGYFFDEVSSKCHLLLSCADLQDITLISPLGEGAVKRVFLAKWKYLYVTVSALRDVLFAEDFNHNVLMLKHLSRSPFITELIGSCNTYIITKYYPFGSALNFPFVLPKLPEENRTHVCFRLCLSFVEIIDYLHNSPIGVRVMCDSNSLEKMLSQFLITTSFKLVANDLDALPAVENDGIKCGVRQIHGDFAAPEQLWPYGDSPFDDEKMPFYDEKVDIWKIPNVCNWFLSFCPNQTHFIAHLQPIHSRCKSTEPNKRPSSSEVVDYYKRTAEKFL